MTFEPANALQSFLPTTLILPESEEMAEYTLALTDYLKKIIQALNDKDIAQYVLSEIVTGQKFFTPADNNSFRFTYRKVINFGSLPNAGISSVAHGINVDANTIFTRIYGVANDPNVSFIPLPFINTITPGDSVELDVDPTNVNIETTTGNYTSYTTTYVILEYLKS